MASFSGSLTGDGLRNRALAWLAGLLEGEGTFLRPSPTCRRLPIIACQMTDADVVQRVATAFGTSVAFTAREAPNSDVYAAKVKGSVAVALMRDLGPLMSRRRNVAISAALEAYVPRERKLDFRLAEEIRGLYTLGESVSSLARSFGVSRPTIREVLGGTIYPAPPARPWRSLPFIDALGVAPRAEGISNVELYWLAGWLEGEGSFIAPPPCDPRRARITAVTRDEDVAAEVGRLLQVTPGFHYGHRERRLGWSPTWRLLRQGRRAAAIMRALHPLMGRRRQEQIESALAAVSREMEAVTSKSRPRR